MTRRGCFWRNLSTGKPSFPTAAGFKFCTNTSALAMIAASSALSSSRARSSTSDSLPRLSHTKYALLPGPSSPLARSAPSPARGGGLGRGRACTDESCCVPPPPPPPPTGGGGGPGGGGGGGGGGELARTNLVACPLPVPPPQAGEGNEPSFGREQTERAARRACRSSA